MQMLFGALVGVLVAWLYSSERARELAQQGLSIAPDRLHQARQVVASAAAGGAQRASEAIDAAPLPDAVKGPASGAAFNAWAAADQLGQSSETAPSTQSEHA